MLKTYSVEMSSHSRERMNKRVKVKSKKKQDRLSELAWERGLLVDVDEKRSSMRLEFDHRIYVFSIQGCLITVYRKKEDRSYRKMNYSRSSWKKEAEDISISCVEDESICEVAE